MLIAIRTSNVMIDDSWFFIIFILMIAVPTVLYEIHCNFYLIFFWRFVNGFTIGFHYLRFIDMQNRHIM